MTNPIQRNQNILSHHQLPSQVHTRHSAPVIRDSLQMRSHPSFFSGLWNTIVHFFQSLFGCCATSSTPKTKIEQIAFRDGFVWFYKKEENPLTAFMGNFHPCTIRLWGLQFNCAEAAFQAAKFLPNRALAQRFEGLDGEQAFRLGRQLTQNWSRQQHAQWRRRNVNAMHEVLQAKFSQNSDLKELLMATGNAYLVEHIPVKGRDAFWGDDSDGTGQNQLGFLLMETRRDLGGPEVVQRTPGYNAFISRL